MVASLAQFIGCKCQHTLNISENYLFQNPDFEVHKFMPTLQVVLVSVFFIAHCVLALIDFLNRYWYWDYGLLWCQLLWDRSIFLSLERLLILIIYQSGLTIHFAC